MKSVAEHLASVLSVVGPLAPLELGLMARARGSVALSTSYR